jgi:hypothetical protein
MGVEKTTQRGALCSVLFIRYYSGDQIKKTEMDKVCNKYWREERCIEGFGGKLEGMRPLGRSRRRRELKMGVSEVGWGHGLD